MRGNLLQTLPIGCMRVFMTPSCSSVVIRLSRCAVREQTGVFGGVGELQDLVARQDQFADQVHQLVEEPDVDADGAFAGGGAALRLSGGFGRGRGGVIRCVFGVVGFGFDFRRGVGNGRRSSNGRLEQLRQGVLRARLRPRARPAFQPSPRRRFPASAGSASGSIADRYARLRYRWLRR